MVFVIGCARPRGSRAEITTKTGAVWTLRDGKVLTIKTFPQREQALKAAGLSE